MKPNPTKAILILLLGLVSQSLMAEEKQEEPDLDFLEFLGSWDTGDKEDMLDPFVLLEVDEEQLNEMATQAESK